MGFYVVIKYFGVYTRLRHS